ncbi:hypothetical protein H2200_010415 [Cladophialophora chaetospira]|uniref:DUF4219 domain-containing protein n=1 Tax=Cladophialophora chaetospira TaxID=386627 RepID=A0AA38X1E3_9EURO|nr:hypothetical protein H2200_010415 [Cladophialophora chaetospira]
MSNLTPFQIITSSENAMAAYFVPDAGANMPPLTGKDNYKEWALLFQIAWQYRGIWGLFNGTEDFLESPTLQAYEDPDTLTAEHERYLKHVQKMQYAMAFLMESVDINIRVKVQFHDKPSMAWSDLKNLYTPTCLDIAEKKMKDLCQKDCKSLGHYLRSVNDSRIEIQRLRKGQWSRGGQMDSSPEAWCDDACKMKIISGLKPEYVHDLIGRCYSLRSIDEMSLKEFGDLLLKREPIIELGEG